MLIDTVMEVQVTQYSIKIIPVEDFYYFRMLKESSVPTIVCVLKPKTKIIYDALEPAGDEVDLEGWKLITLTSIMRSSKALSSLGYDLEESSTVANTNNIVGIYPTVICINEWNIENIQTGLQKAFHLAGAKQKEDKLVLLVDKHVLLR